MNRARSSLVRARCRHPEVYLEDLCFDAQQAAEKALKAVLLVLGGRFRRVHDLAEILGEIESTGLVVPPGIRESARLSDYAVEACYPGPAEPVTEQEYLEAVALAEAVLAWAESQFQQARPD
jgi:HEPN domain-containing protein